MRCPRRCRLLYHWQPSPLSLLLIVETSALSQPVLFLHSRRGAGGVNSVSQIPNTTEASNVASCAGAAGWEELHVCTTVCLFAVASVVAGNPAPFLSCKMNKALLTRPERGLGNARVRRQVSEKLHLCHHGSAMIARRPRFCSIQGTEHHPAGEVTAASHRPIYYDRQETAKQHRARRASGTASPGEPPPTLKDLVSQASTAPHSSNSLPRRGIKSTSRLALGARRLLSSG